jgi:hypothetical protein
MGNSHNKYKFEGQDLRSDFFFDHELEVAYQYNVGDNVMLCNESLAYSLKHNYEPIGKILDMKRDDSGVVNVQLRLFKHGKVESYGDVGINANSSDFWVVMQTNIKPLPIYLSAASTTLAIKNTETIVCQKFPKKTCVPCRKYVSGIANTQLQERIEKISNELKRVGKPGQIRYYVFVCPSFVEQENKQILDSELLNCSVVAFCVYTNNKGENTTRMVSVFDEFVFQSVCLYLSGMKLDHVSYRSVDWTRLPFYRQLKLRINPQKVICKSTGKTYITDQPKFLVENGYELLDTVILPEYAAKVASRELE